jgi:hypothetical protein
VSGWSKGDDEAGIRGGPPAPARAGIPSHANGSLPVIPALILVCSAKKLLIHPRLFSKELNVAAISLSINRSIDSCRLRRGLAVMRITLACRSLISALLAGAARDDMEAAHDHDAERMAQLGADPGYFDGFEDCPFL